MNNVSNLTVHKNKKKLELMKNDLEVALTIIKLIKFGLNDFTIYVPIRDLLINATQNQRLIEDHLNNINLKLSNY